MPHRTARVYVKIYIDLIATSSNERERKWDAAIAFHAKLAFALSLSFLLVNDGLQGIKVEKLVSSAVDGMLYPDCMHHKFHAAILPATVIVSTCSSSYLHSTYALDVRYESIESSPQHVTSASARARRLS